MGLGNGNPNSGNLGSNWRYEFASLKLLEQIVAALTTGTNTYTSVLAVVDGTVAAGAHSIAAYFSPDFTGGLNGVARTGGSTISISADIGKTLPAVSYVVNTGSIAIDIIS